MVDTQKRPKRFYAIVILVVLLLGVIVTYWLFASHLTGPGPVEIQVTTEKPSYLQGETANFTIHVYNFQTWSVPYPSRVDYKIGEDSITKLISLPSPIPAFRPQSKTFYDIFIWDQKTGTGGNRTQVAPGNYTLMVSFHGIVSYGEGGNCTIKILPKS